MMKLFSSSSFNGVTGRGATAVVAFFTFRFLATLFNLSFLSFNILANFTGSTFGSVSVAVVDFSAVFLHSLAIFINLFFFAFIFLANFIAPFGCFKSFSDCVAFVVCFFLR